MISLALTGQQLIDPKYDCCLTLLKKLEPIILNNQLASPNSFGSKAKMYYLRKAFCADLC
jgi:hypothetical protein